MENRKHYRILTHAGCTDGFYSAWIMKRYFNELTKLNLTRKEIDDIPVLGYKPAEVQVGEIELKKDDILLDLPLPENMEVFMWVDHHSSAKPKREIKEHEHWKLLPSCTGQLIEMYEENGFQLSEELKKFKVAIDKIDSADYSEEEIMESYYSKENYENASPLLKVHILSSFIHTKDLFLNDMLLKNLTAANMAADSPISDKSLWQLRPILFHEARLKGHIEWREQVDSYIEYDKKSKTIVQDSRKIHRSFGIVDRFYQYIKFPEASYAIIVKEKNEDLAYLGVGCNIFHKERCKVDIGKLCKTIATTFGTGGGGGHKTVGGAVIKIKHADNAIKKIIDAFVAAE